MKNVGQDIKEASRCILNGEIIVFPTETVYGIGANVFNKEAVDKIFKAKKRPNNKPLIVLISSYEMLDTLVDKTNSLERKIMKTFWPGPISIILPCKSVIPQNVTAGLNNVAIRMTSNNVAREIIDECNVPIVAPSANISDKPSATKISDIYEDFKDSVSYFYDDGECEDKVASTLVKVENDKIVVLREGRISIQQIKEKIENVNVYKSTN